MNALYEMPREQLKERYFMRRFPLFVAAAILKEYDFAIKEQSCLGRFVVPCHAKIRLAKWDNEAVQGYGEPRQGFCSIEVGVGPEPQIAFYGFKHEEEVRKWIDFMVLGFEKSGLDLSANKEMLRELLNYNQESL